MNYARWAPLGEPTPFSRQQNAQVASLHYTDFLGLHPPFGRFGKSSDGHLISGLMLKCT